MSDSIFRVEGDAFVPTEHARGPWDPRALHGGAPAALIAAVFERVQPGEDLPIARLHYEFLRPIPMAPLQLRTSITRPGRRVQGLAAELRANEQVVCRASALRILPAPEELPDDPVGALLRSAEPEPIAPPQSGEDVRFALDGVSGESFAASAMQMRFLSGRPLVGELPGENGSRHTPSGAATVWMRLRHPLLVGEPLTPLARVAASADFGNGVAAAVPFDRYLFINADLTIELDRAPQGEWIALDARTLLHPGGIGWAESILHDERGAFGRARQALVVQPRSS
ncbi:MAG TPA: thioesterase family protein [Solirubrobacteraceae bacterium]|jgi:acyl-coenzyme A thioesterase PaaI-like protein|nr:thioesterase family protein [Solirubrobacteraceae bacterium]